MFSRLNTRYYKRLPLHLFYTATTLLMVRSNAMDGFEANTIWKQMLFFIRTDGSASCLDFFHLKGPHRHIPEQDLDSTQL